MKYLIYIRYFQKIYCLLDYYYCLLTIESMLKVENIKYFIYLLIYLIYTIGISFKM